MLREAILSFVTQTSGELTATKRNDLAAAIAVGINRRPIDVRRTLRELAAEGTLSVKLRGRQRVAHVSVGGHVAKSSVTPDQVHNILLRWVDGEGVVEGKPKTAVIISNLVDALEAPRKDVEDAYKALKAAGIVATTRGAKPTTTVEAKVESSVSSEEVLPVLEEQLPPQEPETASKADGSSGSTVEESLLAIVAHLEATIAASGDKIGDLEREVEALKAQVEALRQQLKAARRSPSQQALNVVDRYRDVLE